MKNFVQNKIPLVTVLTDPLPWGKQYINENARRVLRKIRDKVFQNKKNYSNNISYRGHFAVTRSLIEGLESIGADFNYNPKSVGQISDTVIVLAGVRTLRQAIRLKQIGRIKKLLVGPNVVVFSSDHDSILASEEIDQVITPCTWVANVYAEDHPPLLSRTFVWPAGVDTQYWQPKQSCQNNRILFYAKKNKGPIPNLVPYITYLNECGWSVDVIDYGCFTHEAYRKKLNESSLMLGFVVCESQGLAWAEAWSMNIPTLIWKRTCNVNNGRKYNNSSAPYLCPENGLFFDDFEDFKSTFEYWVSHRTQFQPRDWVLNHMSDSVCASMLYKQAVGEKERVLC